MRTTRALTIIAILGIAFSFRASAKVVYDSETTNEWFSVDMSTLTADSLKESPWTSPSDDGEAVVESKVIKLDTDFGNPLTYAAQDRDSTNVAIVAVEMTATVNASEPELEPIPQAALCVIGTETATNWVGLVGANNEKGYTWETFATPTPVAGETYSIRIEFDQRQGQSRRIRYRVGDTVLGSGDGWYPNPKSGAVNIASVSFSGAGDISGLGGSNVVENAATFNGVGYPTFADALAAAKAQGSGWSAEKPVVLYKNAAYDATESEVLFVNPNERAFTINGEVVTRESGFTYTITKKAECEAYIGSTYYVTFDEAVAAAGADAVIVVNKALTKDLAITKSLGVNPGGKLTCSTLTVDSGVAFNLAGDLSVQTATVNGSVTGVGILTVTGTLTGVNVAKLALGDSATFAYDGTSLGSSTTLTLGTALKIGGLGSAAIDTVVIDNAAVSGKNVSMFIADPALPEGLMLDVGGNVLKVVKEPPAIVITNVEDAAGYDFTNGTINVKTTVRSGMSGILKLTVYDFNGTIRETVSRTVSDSTTDVSWDLADLTAGGTYSYEIVINDGSKDIGTAYGEFTAANWDDDVWFGADASKGEGERVIGGEWETEPTIDPVGKVYVIEEDSVFNVTEQELGSNRVTRVDAKVTFESLVDGDVDMPEGGAIGGFVAASDGWKALTENGWVTLTGAPAPVAGKPYVVRAEVDFISAIKRVRYLVSEDDGATFIPLSSETAQWIALVDQNKDLLQKVELQGSGKVAKFEARVADKAIAEVAGVAYDTMAEVLAAAGTEGTNTIKLLTNATVEPKEKGKYEISAEGHQYVSGGKVSSGDKTIIIDEPGKQPVVRPSDATMKDVKTPDGKSYKNYDSLRKFLEKNKVGGYTDDNADAQSISNALETTGANSLKLWQDYALGIDVGTSVAPVTIPTGDVDERNITLSIPDVAAATPSGDYDIMYKVGDDVAEDAPQTIKIPLDTGTYSIKAIFTPKPEQAEPGI